MGIIKKYGLGTALFLAKRKLKYKRDMYSYYIKKEDRNSIDLPPLEIKPLVSIILFADGDITETLNSIKNQTNYNNFEVIVISNKDIECEASAVIVEYGCDKNSAFKVGFDIAKGEYVSFADSNMILSDTAIYYMMRQLIYNEYDLIYCDEDIIENSVRKNPFFKPCWSPHTLRSFNYIGFALIKRSLITDFKDYYGLLIELSHKNISAANVERVLVHYKKMDREERNISINNYYDRVSIIIPSKDNYNVLKRCIDSIRNKSDYKNYEIIVVDNGSDGSIKNKVSDIADKYIYEKMDFNFSKMCNIGAKNAEGEFLLFLNDDTEVISEDWIDKMLSYAEEPQTGAVGCKLLYPDGNKIQHCGVINIKNGPVHGFIGFEDSGDLYYGRNKYAYNYSAVTAACMMIKKDKFKGFCEELPVAYNDVDLCYGLIEEGYYNVVVNTVKLYHYESLSRGDDRKNDEKLLRLYDEREKLYNRHKDFVFNDKFYNRNLTQHRADFSVENIDYINRGKFARAILNPERFFSDDINYNIEYMYDGDVVNIGGWAYIESRSAAPFVVVMTRSDVAIPIEANIEIRQDISAKTGKKVNLCGFNANIDTNMFERGCYQLGIMLVDKFTLKRHIVLIDKRIQVRV